MNNPYNEIFETVIELSRQLGYDTFTYLPDEQQSYPFVYIGNQVNTDTITKDRLLGSTHLQIDIYSEQDFRSEVAEMVDELQRSVMACQQTEHFGYVVTDTSSHIQPDTTSDINLWHGVLELDIKYL